MVTELTLTTTVLPGGEIEVSAPELRPGQPVTVIVRVEDEQIEPMTITERLARANYLGVHSSKRQKR